MSIFIENIKLYNPFGNRNILLNYILLIFCTIMLYASLLTVKLNGDTENLKDLSIVSYFIFLFTIYSLGIAVSRIHLDFITKPFASCLPDNYKITGIIILLTGFTNILIYSTLYIAMTHYMNMTWVYYINIFFSGLFVYFGVVLFFLFIKNEYKKYIIFISIFIILMVLGSVIDGDIKFTFSDYISFSTIPFITITLCMMSIIFTSMIKPEFKIKYFSGNNPFSFEPIDPKSAPKINEELRIKELPEKKSKPGILEKSFFKLLMKTKHLSDARIIISKEYCTLDKFFTLTGWYSWIIILTGLYLITAILLLSGYAPFSDEPERNLFFIKHVLLHVGIFFLCYMVVSEFIPVYHNLLLPVGRQGQFRSTLFIFLIQIAIAILWLFVVIAISWLIKGNIQPESYNNSGFIYNPLGFPLLLWPLVIIPTLDIFIYYNEKPCSIITMLVFLAVLMALSLYSILGLNPFYASISMALAIVISNGFYIGRLYSYWFKKDIELLD